MYKSIWGVIFLIIAVVETNLLTNFTKTAMGVLKPHFLKECKPDVAVTGAMDGTWVNEHETVNICTGDVDSATDARRSFPSGHASQVAVGIAYGYLELSNLHEFGGVCKLLQTGGVLYAFYIWSLRITNNQHHWADVLMGALLGIIIGVYSYYLKQNQVRRQYRIKVVPTCDSPSRPQAETRMLSSSNVNLQQRQLQQSSTI